MISGRLQGWDLKKSWHFPPGKAMVPRRGAMVAHQGAI